MNRGRLGATSLAIGLLLTGCAVDPAPTAAPTSVSPSVSETPEPEPAVAVVLLGSETIDLLDDTGEQLDSIDYADDTAGAVAVLSDAFGSEPDVVPYAAQHLEETNGTSYLWPGLEVRDYDYPAVLTPPYTWQFQLFVTAAEVGGISVQTVGGLEIGSSLDSVLAAGAVPYPYNAGISTHSFYHVDLVDVPPPAEENQDPAHRMVNLKLEPAGANGNVIEIIAPRADYQY